MKLFEIILKIRKKMITEKKAIKVLKFIRDDGEIFKPITFIKKRLITPKVVLSK
ncbi:MAG: hypothetical protein ACOCP8_05565 [archaeon]